MILKDLIKMYEKGLLSEKGKDFLIDALRCDDSELDEIDDDLEEFKEGE